jgi:hypothetical protein
VTRADEVNADLFALTASDLETTGDGAHPAATLAARV